MTEQHSAVKMGLVYIYVLFVGVMLLLKATKRLSWDSNQADKRAFS